MENGSSMEKESSLHFIPCKKRAVSTLEYCLDEAPVRDNEVWWKISRESDDSCYKGVMEVSEDKGP